MPPGLSEFGQGRWASGMVRSVARHLIPEDAAWDIQNGLLDDDGNVYLRGATKRITSNELGPGGGTARLHALWETQFWMGRRTVGITMAGSARFGVLDAAGTSWLATLGSSGFNAGGLMAQLGDIAFLPTDQSTLAYAGSRKTANYSTGTVTFTAGSKIVTGVGTAWLANADAGMFINQGGGGNLGLYGVVESVDSNTQITLREPWIGTTAAGVLYQVQVFNQLQTLTSSTSLTTAVAAVGGRLFYADGRKVRMSPTIDPNTGRSRIWPFEVTTYADFHEFPADVIAMTVLRERIYVFTKAGIYVITNPALEQVDAFGNPQQRVERASGDVVLRAPSGLAPWRDSMIVCATDGVYVMDPSGGLELVSRSIAPLWQSYAAAGYVPGQIATFRDHAFIPLFDPLSSGAGTGIMLVARLDRRIKTPAGVSAPWVTLTGEAGAVRAACVQDPYGTAKVIAGTYANGYLLDLTGLFSTGPLLPTGSSATTATDAIGSTYGLTLETREYVVDAGAVATVKDVALEYEAAPAAAQIAVSVSVSQRVTADVDPTFTALSALTVAGNFASQAPRVRAVGREARRVAFRITTSGANTAAIRVRALRGRARLRGRRR